MKNVKMLKFIVSLVFMLFLTAGAVFATVPVFTSGYIGGDNIYENCDNGYGGANYFTFTVTGPPNTTWTVYSLPEGNPYNDSYVSYNTVIATITLDSSGNGSYMDSGAGTFDWSSQFYQLVSSDESESSAIFGYTVVDVPQPDGSYGSGVTNTLFPAGSGTVADALPGVDIFWHSSTGEHIVLSPMVDGYIEDGVFFDDSTEFEGGYAWDGDFEWDPTYNVWWGYSSVWNEYNEWDPTGYILANSFPYGYGDTYWFFNLPADSSDYYGNDHALVSFVGMMP